NEIFTLRLSAPVNAIIADSAGVGTITNDDGSLGVEDLPTSFALRPAVPNPFTRQTVIGFDLPRSTVVWLRIYDVHGRLIRTLVQGREMPAGRHRASWDVAGPGDGRV